MRPAGDYQTSSYTVPLFCSSFMSVHCVVVCIIIVSSQAGTFPQKRIFKHAFLPTPYIFTYCLADHTDHKDVCQGQSIHQHEG